MIQSMCHRSSIIIAHTPLTFKNHSFLKEKPFLADRVGVQRSKNCDEIPSFSPLRVLKVLSDRRCQSHSEHRTAAGNSSNGGDFYSVKWGDEACSLMASVASSNSETTALPLIWTIQNNNKKIKKKQSTKRRKSLELSSITISLALLLGFPSGRQCLIRKRY